MSPGNRRAQFGRDLTSAKVLIGQGKKGRTTQKVEKGNVTF